MTATDLTERIAEYVERPDRDRFLELALDAFAGLYRRDRAYRDLCERRGARPGELDDWRRIPTWPASATAVPVPVRATPLLHAAADRAFELSCLDGLHSPPILQLVPGDGPARECDRWVARFGGPGSTAAVAGERVDVLAARSWLAGRQRDGRATVVLASAAALDRLGGALERQGLKLQLAPGSRIVRVDGVDSRPAARICADRLGIEAAMLRGRLSVTGVPTPLFGQIDAHGGLGEIEPSPWLRVHAATDDGRLAILDLTLRDGPFHLLTGTRGSVESGVVRVPPAWPG